MWCAVRAPIGRSKSGRRSEACRALEGNVAELQLSLAVQGPTEQFQPLACIRRWRPSAHAGTQVRHVACWASVQKSSSCSSRDYGSLVCKASKRSIPCSAGLASWRTCSLQIAEATEHLLPAPRIISCQSSCFDSRAIRRTSQGLVRGIAERGLLEKEVGSKVGPIRPEYHARP